MLSLMKVTHFSVCILQKNWGKNVGSDLWEFSGVLLLTLVLELICKQLCRKLLDRFQ